MSIIFSGRDFTTTLTEQFAACNARGGDITQYLIDLKIDRNFQFTDDDRRKIKAQYEAIYGYDNTTEDAPSPVTSCLLIQRSRNLPSFVPLLGASDQIPAISELAPKIDVSITTPSHLRPDPPTTNSSSQDDKPATPTKRPRGRPPGVKNRDKNAPPPVKIPKKRGRPEGSRNKPKDPNAPPKVHKPKQTQPASGGPIEKQMTPARQDELLAAAETPTPIRIAPASNLPPGNHTADQPHLHLPTPPVSPSTYDGPSTNASNLPPGYYPADQPHLHLAPYDGAYTISIPDQYQQAAAPDYTFPAAAPSQGPYYGAYSNTLPTTHQQAPAATHILGADQITTLQTFNTGNSTVDIPIDPRLTTMDAIHAAPPAPMPKQDLESAEDAQYPTPPPEYQPASAATEPLPTASQPDVGLPALEFDMSYWTNDEEGEEVEVGEEGMQMFGWGA